MNLSNFSIFYSKENNTNLKKARDGDDDLGTFKSSKNIAKKLIRQKKEKKGKTLMENLF